MCVERLRVWTRGVSDKRLKVSSDYERLARKQNQNPLMEVVASARKK